MQTKGFTLITYYSSIVKSNVCLFILKSSNKDVVEWREMLINGYKKMKVEFQNRVLNFETIEKKREQDFHGG